MIPQKLDSLLMMRVDRGCTLHEEQNAHKIAARIATRGDYWVWIRDRWPPWYTEDGELKPDHEALRKSQSARATYDGSYARDVDDYIREAFRYAQAAAENRRRRAEDLKRRTREEEEERDKAKRAAARAANAKPGTVGHRANQLLMIVVATTTSGVRWGIPYNEILARLRAEFPNNNPTLNTLRWYETKLRAHYGKGAVPKRNHD